MSYLHELQEYVKDPTAKLPILPPVSLTTRAILKEMTQQMPPALEATIGSLYDRKRKIEQAQLKESVIYFCGFLGSALGINYIARNFFHGLSWPVAFISATAASFALVKYLRKDLWSLQAPSILAEITEFESYFTDAKCSIVIEKIGKRIASFLPAKEQHRLEPYRKAVEEIQGVSGYFEDNEGKSILIRAKQVHDAIKLT